MHGAATHLICKTCLLPALVLLHLCKTWLCESDLCINQENVLHFGVCTCTAGQHMITTNQTARVLVVCNWLSLYTWRVVTLRVRADLLAQPLFKHSILLNSQMHRSPQPQKAYTEWHTQMKKCTTVYSRGCVKHTFSFTCLLWLFLSSAHLKTWKFTKLEIVFPLSLKTPLL